MIRIDNLHVRSGRFAITDLNLDIPTSQYAVLMGRTGCGKTTLLEVICGLRQSASGRVWLNGVEATRLKPGARGIGYVPQDKALFDHLTVREHLAFSLRLRRWGEKEVTARIDELSEMLGITHLLSRLPLGLSGGEAQRVALGRALASRPGILVLDEPLSALDEETRESMCALLRSVHRSAKVTVLHVTHNRTEAEAVGGRLIRMRDGKLEEENDNAGQSGIFVATATSGGDARRTLGA